MPLYEYTCEACHEELELLVRSGEPPVCEACGSERLARRLSVPAAHTAGGMLPIQAPSNCARPGCGGGGCGMGM